MNIISSSLVLAVFTFSTAVNAHYILNNAHHHHQVDKYEKIRQAAKNWKESNQSPTFDNNQMRARKLKKILNGKRTIDGIPQITPNN